MVDGARRAMRATFQREMDFSSAIWLSRLDGLVSPYVGLFGTVWASCTPFAASRTFSRRRSRRSPPASPRPLVATAIGLFAAIPAVVAYNRYSYDIERLGNRFESFMEEFSNILHRQR